MALVLDGSANTIGGLAVGGLPDGIVDSDMVADSVTRITEFDQWYLSQNKSSNGNLTNFTRVSATWTGSASQIGTGMEVSSEVWTFPSTGKWLVICNGQFNCNDSDNVIIYTQVSLDSGSSYANNGSAIDGNNDSSGGSRTGSAISFSFIDVTNTGTIKVKFYADSIGSGSAVRGTTTVSGGMQTNVIFIRLGDT
tara:strand:+ start:173 stop:757 length:585 start_codon:yes stop_codon:yes gene_type:complete